MAWPLTPLTTYVPGTTPAIGAFDLNEIQDAINKIHLGTRSLAGATLDGVGGAGAVAPSGLKITIANPGAGVGHQNTLTAANIPKAWGIVESDTNSIFEGFNCPTIADSPTANRTRITMATGMSSTNYGVLLTPNLSGGAVWLSAIVISATQFDVAAFDVVAGVPQFINLQSVTIRMAFAVFGKQ